MLCKLTVFKYGFIASLPVFWTSWELKNEESKSRDKQLSDANNPGHILVFPHFSSHWDTKWAETSLSRVSVHVSNPQGGVFMNWRGFPVSFPGYQRDWKIPWGKGERFPCGYGYDGYAVVRITICLITSDWSCSFRIVCSLI